MVSQSNPYPSMIDLQVSISDVEQLLTSYQQAHQSYITDLKAGLHKESKLNLDKMRTLNDRIISRLDYIQEISNKISSQESIYKK